MKKFKKIQNKTIHNAADAKLFRLYHENLEELVPQLTKIVMEQVKLHEATTKQSTADLQEAMGISIDVTLKKRKTRRGKTGNRENRSERHAPKAAASSGSAPVSIIEESAAARRRVWPVGVRQKLGDSTSSSNEESNGEIEWYGIGTKCTRCMENGFNTPARMNGYTGLVLCLACTKQFFDPNKLDANCAPGRVIAVDAN